MNAYYKQLYNVVFHQFGIKPDEKIIYKNCYLTVHDYLLAVSVEDRVKNILALLKTFSDRDEALEFLHSAISRIIKEVIVHHNNDFDFFKFRLREINKIF